MRVKRPRPSVLDGLDDEFAPTSDAAVTAPAHDGRGGTAAGRGREPAQAAPAQTIVVQVGSADAAAGRRAGRVGRMAKAVIRAAAEFPGRVADLLWWALDTAVVLLVVGLIAALAFPRSWPGEVAIAAGKEATRWLYEHASWLFVSVRMGGGG
ncbi:MAG: hypothetical protein QJR08_00465 [Bacillota bacterium]|nr:hypothetical protein [Bacillota bacterium]